MLRLRSQFDVFTLGQETLSVNGDLKKIQLSLNNHNINLMGNFGLNLNTISPKFQHTGTWYEFFTGNELSVTDLNYILLLNPGEFRLYSDVKLPAFKDLATSASEGLNPSELNIYPNPVTDQLSIESTNTIQDIKLYSIEGKVVYQNNPNVNNISISLINLKSGIYLLRAQTSNQLFTKKIIKN
jgi:hypothetical protein